MEQVVLRCVLGDSPYEQPSQPNDMMRVSNSPGNTLDRGMERVSLTLASSQTALSTAAFLRRQKKPIGRLGSGST